MKNGIDISKHQGAPDWARLAAQHRAGRLDFVLIRAGYGGGTVDPCFEANYAAAHAAGIPVGAYWYAYWGPYTPAQEAASFLRTAAGKRLEYGLWYDVEYEPDILGMGKAARTDRVLEGLAALAASGRYVGLYASTDMINNRLEYARLAAYDLWVAQYSSICTCKRGYGIWQYTSGGSVEGIAGRVDCDRAYKDYPAFVVGPLAGESAAGSIGADGAAGSMAEDAGAGAAGSAAAGNNTADEPTGSTEGAQGGADKPAPLPTPLPGQENQLPREVHTWRVAGAGKAKADKLLAFCDRLGLYILGSIEVQPERGAAELLSLANELLIGTAGTLSMSIGPATRGDLIQVLQAADGAGLQVRFAWDIGPVSTGDTVALRALCQETDCSMEEAA